MVPRLLAIWSLLTQKDFIFLNKTRSVIEVDDENLPIALARVKDVSSIMAEEIKFQKAEGKKHESNKNR